MTEKDELMKKTVKELLVLARRLGLRGVSRLRKAQLIAKLLETMRALPPSRRRRAPTRRSTRGARAATAGGGSYTRKELLALAKQQGLTGVSRLRKAQLLARVVGAPFPEPPVPPSLPHLPPLPAELLSGEPPGATAPQATTADIAAVAASPLSPHAAPSPVSSARDRETRAVLLARDPYQLYAYWEVPAVEDKTAPPAAHEGQLVVRVIAESPADTSQDGALSTLTLPATVSESFIAVPQPATSYRVEIGYRTRDGQFTLLARSNVATTPQAAPSPLATVQWFTPSGSPASLPSPPPRLDEEAELWSPGPSAPASLPPPASPPPSP